MSSTVAFDEEQLKAARVKAWHQTGNEADAIVTIEAAREWLNGYGLVLYAPRPQLADAPAPTFVEATLGKPTPAPTMVESEIARSLVARLVSDGSAVPLNLLGVPGDAPDFVVSAQVFSYVFTMRGDKAWKQPPATAGAVKVSPLGLRVYEALTERGALTAQELAQELGREVTETAILRALSELWSQLRVLPLVQLGREVTLWELTSKRFTKTIKAGANAGQPSALSALVSLYLAQVFAATEEEIATFLSPLTARSRVREVLHALMGARQLETLVVEGKTLVHIPGAIPAFPQAAVPDDEGEPVEAAERPKKIGTGRISSFTSETKAVGEFRGKPAGKGMAGSRKSVGGTRSASGPRPVGGARPVGRTGGKTFGAKPASKYGPRLDGKTDAVRRPFKKDGAGKAAFSKPAFNKPWEEEKAARPAKAEAPDGFTKFRRPAPEDREPLGPREQAGLPPERRSAPKATRSFDRGRPAFERKPAFGARPEGAGRKPGGFAKRPYASDGAAKPYAKRPFTPRTEEGGERPTFKPRSYEGKGFAGKKSPGDKKPYAAKAGGFAKKPYTARTDDAPARPYAKRPFTPRGANGEEGGERTSSRPTSFGTKNFGGTKKFAEKKSFGDKPYAAKAGGFAKKPYERRESRSDGAAKPFARRAAAPRGSDDFTATPVERTIPKRPFKPRAADADQRKFTKAPWTPDEGVEAGAGKKRASGPRSGGAKRPFAPRKPRA